jgi:hypothetical protein
MIEGKLPKKVLNMESDESEGKCARTRLSSTGSEKSIH